MLLRPLEIKFFQKGESLTDGKRYNLEKEKCGLKLGKFSEGGEFKCGANTTD